MAVFTGRNLIAPIVGYAQKATLASGNQMLAAQFANIGATDGSAKLSDLSVGGYEKYDPDTDEGGTSGELSIQFLNSSGGMEARYYWYDDDEKTGWFDRSGNDASAVTFAAGTGVWVSGRGLSMRIPAPELN